MTDGIAKRLRNFVELQVGDVPVLIHQAAEHIDALAAELQSVLERESATTARYDAKLAEVTAERDRLDATIPAIREIMYSEKARAEKADAALATARRDAREEAAERVEQHRIYAGQTAFTILEEIAAAIRALPDNTEEGGG